MSAEILIIDDNADIRSILKDLINDAGFKTRVAANYSQALAEIDKKNLIKPYYTTKLNGSGLGLSIVNKIINDHNGSIKFLNHKNGAKIQIIIPII